jgi:plastocyanin
MLHPVIKMLPLLLSSLLALPAQAKDFTVAQKDKKFSQAKLEVKVGDVVNFKNEDPFSIIFFRYLT